MTKFYTLENKPNFKNEETVWVDFSKFNGGEEHVIIGEIVGKGSTHIIDYWLINFGTDHAFYNNYPYPVISVPHTFIVET